jgi:hypothetical protein
MQRLKGWGTALMTVSCLVTIAGSAAAEPVSTQPAAKKHAECEGSKVKTACNQAADVRDLVKGRQAPATSAPTADGNQATVPNSRQELEPVSEDGAGAKPPPASIEKAAPQA